MTTNFSKDSNVILSLTQQDPANSATHPTTRSKGHGTILLVEDTASLREVTKEFLQIAGYTVLEASSGGEALDLIQQVSQPIHLLLTDVIMPGMSGPDLAKSLQALYPSLQVLYMSGYADNRIIQKGGIDPGTNLLSKPFTRDKLTTKVREIIGS
jgi:two-component system, cell cycle sensor histidine kinase and response regulator CckA